MRIDADQSIESKPEFDLFDPRARKLGALKSQSRLNDRAANALNPNQPWRSWRTLREAPFLLLDRKRISLNLQSAFASKSKCPLGVLRFWQ